MIVSIPNLCPLSNFNTLFKLERGHSGRVLDSRPRGRGFETHRRHCVVSLSKNINPSLVLVQPRKTHPFITERLLMGRKEPNQTNIIEVFVFLQSCNTSEPDLCLIREDPMKTAIHKDASVTKVMMKQTNLCSFTD